MNGLGDGLTVHRRAADGAQHQQIESTLQNIGPRALCHLNFLSTIFRGRILAGPIDCQGGSVLANANRAIHRRLSHRHPKGQE
jgi:hypothetical protein